MLRASLSATLACALLVTGSAHAEQPWRLHTALNAPEWLTLDGEARVRYESLDGQFRAGGSGGDQILAFRTLLLMEADAGPVAFGLELQDSRASFDDAGTPLSTSVVNPLDVLQAYARFDLDGAFGAKDAALTLGRQTISIGSQRVFERVEMANVIFSYTGAYWRSTSPRGDELHLLAVAPTGRMPADRPSLADDTLSGDEEQWGRLAWGAHYRAANALGAGVWLESYLYGLNERDTASVPTPNRDYLQPGFRVSRAAKAGEIDFDVEGAWRTGSRRATAAAADTRDLGVDAAILYAHVGYTWDHPWRPRVALDYYYASGDSDPTDGRYGQFERLFGGRRTDLGATGIHGPLTSANIEAPGARFELRPDDRSDLRIAYKAAFLAEEKDAWVDARLQDVTGQSGRFIGHSIDFRARRWLAPDGLQLEVGAAALIQGRFAKEAPGAPRQGDTLYGYVQLTKSF